MWHFLRCPLTIQALDKILWEVGIANGAETMGDHNSSHLELFQTGANDRSGFLIIQTIGGFIRQ
jgi:hypothetical protein